MGPHQQLEEENTSPEPIGIELNRKYGLIRFLTPQFTESRIWLSPRTINTSLKIECERLKLVGLVCLGSVEHIKKKINLHLWMGLCKTAYPQTTRFPVKMHSKMTDGPLTTPYAIKKSFRSANFYVFWWSLHIPFRKKRTDPFLRKFFSDLSDTASSLFTQKPRELTFFMFLV